ncbi:hypothetical protein BD410DRAFT_36399 [Rickenella mellea]|uniref:Uncharacterized protein n=1 Tax=Rickenella mellea TaxID=50990 RepID=A0A4R5XEY5_9AGAM|nr:hypothetical protein BD410DRAFT_36399 [Rickenella mellea]
MDNTTDFIFDLPQADTLKPSSTRKVHIRRLNDILHLSIQRGDMLRARQVWSILARCKEYDWMAMWRMGLLLANPHSHPPSSNTNTVTARLDYLRVMMLRCPDDQESILSEIVLQLIFSENFKDAIDELDLYLPSFPFQNNPVLHLYAGLSLLCLASKNRDEFVDQLSTSNHLRNSQTHFDRVITLDAHNVIASTFLEQVLRSVLME